MNVFGKVGVGILSSVVLLACVAGCRKPDVPQAPHPRIVSFSPALTDMLYDMGLGSHVIGVTTQCQPPAAARPVIVGDAMTVNAEKVASIEPDVLLVQMNPASFERVRQLAPQVRVEHFSIETLADISAAIARIGDLAGEPQIGLAKRAEFDAAVAAVRARVDGMTRPRVMIVWGRQSPATGGAGTFIDEMITAAGGVNAADKYDGWKNLGIEQIIERKPDVLICQEDSPADAEPSRQYWLSQKDIPAAVAGRVFIVTDRRWTIPSTRTPQYLRELSAMIHPTPASGPNGH